MSNKKKKKMKSSTFQNIKCSIGFHVWSDWQESDKVSENILTTLTRYCKHCLKIDEYTGLIQHDILTSAPSPYIYKN